VPCRHPSPVPSPILQGETWSWSLVCDGRGTRVWRCGSGAVRCGVTGAKLICLSDAQYGAVSSASNLINTILPIIGGIGMDYWGAT
jgi:hypothetical protein